MSEILSSSPIEHQPGLALVGADAPSSFRLCDTVRDACMALLRDNDDTGAPLSDAQARQMTEALWSLVTAFIDLAFRSDSVSLLPAQSCGQSGDQRRKPAVASAPVLYCEDHTDRNGQTKAGAVCKARSSGKEES